jgi:aminoglycoside 6-adenylyltransferase
MIKDHIESEILEKISNWGEIHHDVRAIILTSSRTNPNAPIDSFSDFDPIFIVDDIQKYSDDRWLEDFGKVLVVYHDPIRIEYGFERFCYVTQYEDGLKIDFTLWPKEILRSIIKLPELPDYLDIGYAILVDKDRITAGLKAPAYKAYIPKPPTPQDYRKVVDGFFLDATYIAKHISRRDLIPLKYEFELIKYENLRMMLEWRMEIDHDWSVKPGANGKGLQQYVRPDIWTRFEKTYVGTGKEENWIALFEAINIFHDVSTEVANQLGYIYPDDLEARVLQYLYEVHDL